MKKYIVSFGGSVRIEAKTADKAIELVSNDMILDNVAFEATDEASND